MPEPEVHLQGAPNFRDLGGYPTDDGRMVVRGRIFRSGHLVELTAGDIAKLEAVGIRTVVDFRHQFEIEVFGEDRLPDGVSYVSLPITAGGMDGATHEALRRGDLSALPDLTAANRNFVHDNTRELGDLLRLLAEPKNLPVVFHCIGGKDRTGIASAVVLSALGVPWSQVQQDYLATNRHIKMRVEDQLSHLARTTGYEGDQSADSLEAARRFFVLEAGYIDAARDQMIAQAGSIANYINRDLAVPGTVVAELRRSLLGPDPGTAPDPPSSVVVAPTEPVP